MWMWSSNDITWWVEMLVDSTRSLFQLAVDLKTYVLLHIPLYLTFWCHEVLMRVKSGLWTNSLGVIEVVYHLMITRGKCIRITEGPLGNSVLKSIPQNAAMNSLYNNMGHWTHTIICRSVLHLVLFMWMAFTIHNGKYLHTFHYQGKSHFKWKKWKNVLAHLPSTYHLPKVHPSTISV